MLDYATGHSTMHEEECKIEGIGIVSVLCMTL